MICRLGGDEFLVDCPDTPLSGALQVAEEVRGSVSRSKFRDSAITETMTVSVGVASRNGEMTGWNVLVRAADAAVYRAKSAGRHCVWSADS